MPRNVTSPGGGSRLTLTIPSEGVKFRAVSLTPQKLVERFHSYGCPDHRWRVGGEFERLPVRPDGKAVPYDGPRGIRRVLELLADRHGWAPEFEGDALIALKRDGASITLEPGGQVELSGAPHETLLAIAREARRNLAEITAIGDELDIRWLAVGVHPVAAVDEVGWVPKSRYVVMREHLGAVGDLAHTMMKATTSFQANFDYRDEADCARKLEAMLALAPLTTALFANSPLVAGRPSGFQSFRGHVWTRTDPARCGLPLARYSHAAWVDYLLDTPLLFFTDRGRYVSGDGRSFRDLLSDGHGGRAATWADWDIHQTSVFPEVRVKRTIEIRGADAVPLPLALAGIAAWTGVMYDDTALDEAAELGRALADDGDGSSRFERACRDGLHAEIAGRRLSGWAEDFVALAGRGLARSRWADDGHLLEPLVALVEEGDSPAVTTLRAYETATSVEALVEALRYR